VAILLTCQALTASSQPVSDDRVAELVRQASAQLGATTRSQADVGATDLTLDEAVARALDNNLDIAVERINPETANLFIASVKGAYRPVVSSTLGTSYIVQLPTSQLIGGTRVENEAATANVGLAYNLPWFGGAVSAAFNNRRQDSTNLFTTFNPQFNATLSFNLVQPLLRGFRIDLTRQQLLVQQINRDISEVELKATLISTVANVRTTYWDLVAAREAVEVARRSVALAEKLIEENTIRVEVGTLAPIDVYQAQSEAAARRQTLAQAEQALTTSALALKRLIVRGTDDPLWPAVINPVDRPDFRPAPVDVAGAVRNALEARTDLMQARKQLESSSVNVRYLGNQRLPGLDVVAGYGLQGIGGTRYIREGTGGPIIAIIPGDYGDAFTMMTNADYPNWNAQLVFSYPIGTSSADALYARSKLQLSQAQARIRALELQVATEVTNIASQIESNLKRVEAATAARELAQKRLEAEGSKFEVGMSTNFFVVQAQRDLFDAQIVELRARLDYQKSLVEFERVQQTTARNGTAAASATLGSASQ